MSDWDYIMEEEKSAPEGDYDDFYRMLTIFFTGIIVGAIIMHTIWIVVIHL